MAIDWNKKSYTDNEFIEAFNNANSWADIIRDLKLTNKSTIPLKKVAEELNLDYSKFVKNPKKYSDELITALVKESTTLADVIRKLDLKLTGSNYNHIRNRVKILQLDTTHFTGQSSSKNKIPVNKKNVHEVLILRTEKSNREKREVLKRCMIEVGIDYTCNICNIIPIWQGEELTLEINHINGNFWDNRKENLEFLCPNCHSQQLTSNRPHKYRNLK